MADERHQLQPGNPADAQLLWIHGATSACWQWVGDFDNSALCLQRTLRHQSDLRWIHVYDICSVVC